MHNVIIQVGISPHPDVKKTQGEESERASESYKTSQYSLFNVSISTGQLLTWIKSIKTFLPVTQNDLLRLHNLHKWIKLSDFCLESRFKFKGTEWCNHGNLHQHTCLYDSSNITLIYKQISVTFLPRMRKLLVMPE